MTNDIIQKLKYINLDLNNIPDSIMNGGKIKYRPKKLLNEKKYKVYKYIDINNIDILITKKNRLTDISERYEQSVPIHEYLIESNIEKFTLFLKLLKQITIEDIKELEQKQIELNKNKPLEIKFEKDYLWQIYYSEEEDKYFMLASIGESEYTEIFYVLKKQLEGKNEKIFVPICHSEYCGKILSKQEIKDLENALWVFTRNWTTIYEVYDENGNMNLEVIGKTRIFETIESDYKLEFNTREEALKVYNIVQALFLLQTHFPHYYKIKIKVQKNANLEFELNETIINSENIVEYIKEEYKNHLENIILLKESKINLENKLKSLKEISTKRQQTFIEKERQISTYLECKKTFIGKVRYFFKYKKVNLLVQKKEEPEDAKKQVQINYGEKTQLKKVYTIQELLEITKELEEESINVKNLKLDIEGIERNIQILENKIERADLYIQEIDNHKKNIFDFWKFTSKDEANQLMDGFEAKQNKKIKKSFNLNLDLDEIKEELDKIVRDSLTKEEQDAIYLTTTPVVQDMNLILNDDKISERYLLDLKSDFRKNKTKMSLNILTGEREGAILNSKGHRETKKSKFSILDIDENTTIQEYKEILKKAITKIDKAKEKIIVDMELPLYYASEGELPKGYLLFSINPFEILNNTIEGKINIYKLIIDENTKIVPLTNIIYFNNLNKTLPIGMDEGTNILLNTKDLQLELIKKENNNIVAFKNGEMKLLEINIFNYKI